MFQSNKNWKCHITDNYFVTNNVNNNVNQTQIPLKMKKMTPYFYQGFFPLINLILQTINGTGGDETLESFFS